MITLSFIRDFKNSSFSGLGGKGLGGIFSANKHQLENLAVEEIYKQCFDQYFEKLFSYAFTILKDNAEAKDIVQSAFVRLWEKRMEVNMSASAQSYLYTSVYRLALNSIRNKKIRESHHARIISIEQKEDLNSAEEKERRSKIQEAIESLPPRCKEVFCKSRFERMKYAAIAMDLNISVKTVEAQMGKALKMLREQLADLMMAFILYFIIQ
jgi:RNA polymerase sigma-70 factor (ECF subfamily)